MFGLQFERATNSEGTWYFEAGDIMWRASLLDDEWEVTIKRDGAAVEIAIAYAQSLELAMERAYRLAGENDEYEGGRLLVSFSGDDVIVEAC